MLPKHERRRLAEIESGLTAEDPDFARRLSPAGCRIPRHGMSPRRWLIAVSVVLAVLCVAFGEGAGFVSAALLATILIATRHWTLRS